jgi:membrane-associated phospholipid phosphatase
MPAPAGTGVSSHYVTGLIAVLGRGTVQLVRPPSEPRRIEAARRMSHQILLLAAVFGAVIVALMFEADVAEIKLMPPRGAPGLWPVRILTDFGKDGYVLAALAAMLLVVAILAPTRRGIRRSWLLGLGMRLQFVFLAVLMPLLAGQLIKWVAGRGRPFVGGKANAFNFAPFNGTEAYASLPSSHAITSFALAFAVSALWPRARVAMAVYVVLIAVSRLVLLAHHPSDVVAGALVGVSGAMVVRYWFAARGLCFAISPDGEIVPPAGRPPGPRKGVAREAAAP